MVLDVVSGRSDSETIAWSPLFAWLTPYIPNAATSDPPSSAVAFTICTTLAKAVGVWVWWFETVKCDAALSHIYICICMWVCVDSEYSFTVRVYIYMLDFVIV